MALIFGFDIGTTSIGSAVIEHDSNRNTGKILWLGTRIFPEARDIEGTPLNQERRQKRMVRRQYRRRRARRKLLNEALSEAGLLPAFNSAEWPEVMAKDPYNLRKSGLSEELTAYHVGRAFYHLAQHRHFKGRDLEEEDDETETGNKKGKNKDDEKKSNEAKQLKNQRESTLQALKKENIRLGAWLDKRRGQLDEHGQRILKRRVHANREVVTEEFEELWKTQAQYHPVLKDAAFKEKVQDVIFAQRPVFWRKNTLGECRFMPGETLCPKGSWLSQQRRMLEKLNNLAIAEGNARPLDAEERAAILAQLQMQPSMSWTKVREALKPLYKERGEAGAEKKLRFNLQLGGEDKLLGNAVEAKLVGIFGGGWVSHPHKQAIRDAAHSRLWAADYGEIGSQRVVIRPAQERRDLRAKATQSFINDFAVTSDQAKALQSLTFPTGWEPYSFNALRQLLPRLEDGVHFGALINGPEWEGWRNETFPKREQPTGEILDRLPSPAVKEERERLGKLRNPTVVRTQNELRKVVNNLIGMFGKPDLIRVELTREVGLSKREREEKQKGIRKQENRRKDAVRDLSSKGIAQPSRDDIEKWMLWKESGECCPYTGDQIGFDALFRRGEYEVEHIWPRYRSFDDSMRNKTLCRRDINQTKTNKTPFEHFGHRAEDWAAIKDRLKKMTAAKGGEGMPEGKVKRFLAESIPEDFASRQLNDTGYAARQAMALLKKLWPDIGAEAPVKVQAVTGRVTAQLRKRWELNNILADDGEKTRADHRHHAIDALTVACTHPEMTRKLSNYWQAKDDPHAKRPTLQKPWETIRADTEKAVQQITVSHRVRKKISGPLHKETVYGDTGEDIVKSGVTYRQFVSRKKVEDLSKSELGDIRDKDKLGDIRDKEVRGIVKDWVATHGGDPKKAFETYPKLGNGEKAMEIRKVRLITKQQLDLMAKVSPPSHETPGYASLGNNHHIAIYRLPDGKAVYEVVSLFEASRRLARREPVVRRKRDDGAVFVMSLSQGDCIEIPSGGHQGIWVVGILSANGQIYFKLGVDARPFKKEDKNKWGPNPSTLLSLGARKISVDPIGRVRKAND